MPSLENPCLLLPHGCERSPVYVCIPVDPDLATKSPVIETLMEFDGFVELPEGIALDDFEAWAAIATEDPSQLALEELSLALQVCMQYFNSLLHIHMIVCQKDLILQVSEKLSAYNSTQLVRALAAKLRATDWRSASEKEAMLHALLSLDKNMQLLVFREAGTLSAPALFSWPIVLQQVRREFLSPYTSPLLTARALLLMRTGLSFFSLLITQIPASVNHHDSA